jgi:lysophospholipase L1-like esterase
VRAGSDRASVPTGALLQVGLLGWLLTTVACSGGPAMPTPVPGAPSLSCPAGAAAPSHNGAPALVTFETPAAEGGASPVSVVCQPASGSMFQIGTTVVVCSAADALARQASCAFTVSVTPIPRLDKVRFLAFGDSITEGKVSLSGLTLTVAFPDAYPFKLQGKLAARYEDQQFTVTNAGLGGEGAGTGARRLPLELSSFQPEVLLLLDGANDLLALRDDGILPVVNALRTMIRDAEARGVRVFLATQPPAIPGTLRGYAASSVPKLNAEIRKLATAEGVTLVDLYAAFPTDPAGLIGADGLHPTAQGYELIAQTFFESIMQTLETTDPLR